MKRFLAKKETLADDFTGVYVVAMGNTKTPVKIDEISGDGSGGPEARRLVRLLNTAYAKWLEGPPS